MATKSECPISSSLFNEISSSTEHVLCTVYEQEIPSQDNTDQANKTKTLN
jgi:hypothetical protein